MSVSKRENASSLNARISSNLKLIGIILWFSLLLIAYLSIIFLIILNIGISNLISFVWIWWPTFKLYLHYLILLFLIHEIVIWLILHTIIHIQIIRCANIKIGVVAVSDVFKLISDVILICMKLYIWLRTYLRAISIILLVCILISRKGWINWSWLYVWWCINWYLVESLIGVLLIGWLLEIFGVFACIDLISEHFSFATLLKGIWHYWIFIQALSCDFGWRYPALLIYPNVAEIGDIILWALVVNIPVTKITLSSISMAACVSLWCVPVAHIPLSCLSIAKIASGRVLSCFNLLLRTM